LGERNSGPNREKSSRKRTDLRKEKKGGDLPGRPVDRGKKKKSIIRGEKKRKNLEK